MKKAINTILLVLMAYGVKAQIHEFKVKQQLYSNENQIVSYKNYPNPVLLIPKTKKKKVAAGSTTNANNSIDSNFIFKPVQNYDTFSIKKFGLPKNAILKVDCKQEKSLIKIYPWKNPDCKTEKLLSKNKYYVFPIPKRTVVRIKYQSYQVGALTLPIKIYMKSPDSLGNSQFDVNAGLLLSKKWGTQRYSYYGEKEKSYFIGQSIGVTAGVSKLELSSANTGDSLTKEIVLASPSIGLVYGFHYSKLNAYFVMGMDLPTSKYSKDWVFRNTPWVGLGVGLGIFK